MLNLSIQGTDKQGKSQLMQRSDTLIIFPYIKSTKNYPTKCVGWVKIIEKINNNIKNNKYMCVILHTYYTIQLNVLYSQVDEHVL